ncbi:MAG: leucine-rich repeat protein [Muribaculaceae bacterium]|nr:leucine-rich repeat protein [Muribaculaceae bacterium]
MKKILLSLVLIISATTSWALEVECTPGNLANLVDDTSITSLTITGQMDARDFKFIATELDALTTIDLSGVTIVEYSDHSKPLFNNDVDYPENCIPTMAFFGKKITQITIPSNTRAIGMAAFAGCDQLVNFTFPEGLDSIAAYAFTATKLNNIVLPTSIRYLGKGVFSNMSNLYRVTIKPSNELVIPESAFEGSKIVYYVTLGPNVVAIGDRAFKGTNRLYGLSFSDENNIRHIGKEAFLASGINNFNFDQATAVTDIDDWAFAQSKQPSATIPANITHVGKGAFYYATNMTSYVPNAASDSIADLLLAGTAVNNDVTAGTEISNIGRYAFYNTPITTLTLPSTTSYIGELAMAGMIDLQEFTIDATEVPALGDNVWLGVKQATIPLKVPRESYEAYSTAAQWSRFLIWADEPQFIYGDVNQDGFITAADITALYDILLGVSDNYLETADVNGDGDITAADITAIYNILLGVDKAPGHNKKTNDSNDKIIAQGFVIEAGKTHNMKVDMTNNAQFAAMQLDITMPQGLTIDNVTTTSRASNMTMGFNEIEPGKWRILIHSATTTSGKEGTMFNITVKADESFNGNETITINNIIAVEPNELVHEIDDIDVEVGTTTGVKDINIDNADNGPVDVYNMNGQLIRQNVERNEATTGLPSGIYIVGGKKVIVK